MSFYRRRMMILVCVLAAQGFTPAAAATRQNAAAVAAAVRAAALGIAPPGASISLGPVTGAEYMQSCGVPLTVTISGIAPYEQAAAHCAAPLWTLYVTVTLAQMQPVVVAARPIAAGQEIGPGDLSLRPEPVALYAGRQVYYGLTGLVGTQAMISLAAGSVLNAEDIDQPVLIKSGQTVTVQVVSGAVTLSIVAIADETGRLGDTILLTNPASGRRFSALVTLSGPVLRLQS